MNRQAIASRVQEIVADVLGTTPNNHLPGLQADSHDWESVQNLNIILAVEAEFQRQFTPEEMERLTSVPRIVDILADVA